MTKAHEGSNLAVRGMTKALPEGMFLFPFDGRVEDTTGAIPVLENVTTPDYENRKFIDSIKIESVTTNLAAGTLTPYEPYNSMTRDGQNLTFTMVGNGAAPYLTVHNGTDYNGKIITLSGYMKKNGVPFKIPRDRANSYHTVPAIRYYFDEETGYFEIVEDCNASTIWLFHQHVGTVAGDVITIENFQVEEKSYATSFTETSRAGGALLYDVSSLNIKDKGCISFWLRNSYNMIAIDGYHFYATLGIDGNTYNDHSIFIGRNPTDKRFRCGIVDSPASGGGGGDVTLTSPLTTQDFNEGEWIHLVVQWDTNGLASGNQMEFFINGKLEGSAPSINPTVSYPKLEVGQWRSGVYCGNTSYEQLALHPSKTFSAHEIKAWYESQAPFYDWRDQILFY